MKNTINADCSVVPAGGFIEKMLFSQRRKMFDAFTAFIHGDDRDTVLNVGTAPASFAGHSKGLLEWPDLRDRSRITSHDIERPDSLAAIRQGRAIHLPFADGQFDWVFCSEVIERMGSFEQQYALVKELARVSRKGVFVTTSNRRHPIEFNTGMPLIHWLPHTWWRRILTWWGKGAWGYGAVLTLLDSAALYKIASLLPGEPKHDVGHKRVFGVKAHFFLMIQKDAVVRKA